MKIGNKIAIVKKMKISQRGRSGKGDRIGSPEPEGGILITGARRRTRGGGEESLPKLT